MLVVTGEESRGWPVPLSLLCSESDAPAYRALSQREVECLRWTAEGKTAWEVGRILGISGQTAARHLSNAVRKMGCTNKAHAVAKALRRGLIE